MRVAGRLQTVEDIALICRRRRSHQRPGLPSGAGSNQRRPKPSYSCLIALLTSGKLKVNSLILKLGAIERIAHELGV
jgi:hypothetical protein